MFLINSFKPEKFFLTLALLSGIIACFLIPIGAGFDEDTHVARIWEMSGFTMLPNQMYVTGPHLPSIFYELSYRQKFIIEPVGLDFWQQNLAKHIDWNVMINHRTRSIYNPLLYVPQAFIMGLLGRFLDAPVLLIYYLCRLAYLACYIIPTYFAIRLIPLGKWLLTLLALSPMAIFQASTITPDSVSNSISFLFIATILWLAYRTKPFKIKHFVIFFMMITLLFSSKINSVVLIFLCALIPRSYFGSKRNYLLTLFGITILFLLLVVGWNSIAITQESVIAQGPDTSPIKQFYYILANPLQFLNTVIDSFRSKIVDYYKEWIGVFGYGYWGMPKVVYILFTLLLGLVVISDSSNLGQNTPNKTKFVLFLTTIIGYLFSVAIIYLTINPVGSATLGYVQGRYFIPILTPILLMLVPKKSIVPENFFKPLFIIGTIILCCIFLAATYLSYHVNCGMSYYTSGHCYQPVYKNWSPNDRFSVPVVKGVSFKQTLLAKCPNMETIRVWTNKPQATESGETNFRMIQTASGRIVLDQTVANQSIPTQDWFSLSIPTIPDSQGEQFELYISSPDGKKDNSIFLGTSTRDEYADGELYIENNLQDVDLLFQYGCNVDETE